MRDELLPYYEQELEFIRDSGREFAAKYEKVARRLGMDSVPYSDPHVERLIEAFALLTGRIQHKLDDEFPEITESILDVLYPHYLRPIPSMAIAQFSADPSQSTVAGPVPIRAGASVHSQPVDGTVATFRTAYHVDLWPVDVTAAALVPVGSLGVSAPAGATRAVRISLQCRGKLTLAQLSIPRLRFFLHGTESLVHTMLELLSTRVVAAAVAVRGGAVVNLPPESISPVGFTTAEGLLPYSDRSFLGYRLIQEYFHFPWKFHFIDLCGLDKADRAGLGGSFDILIFTSELEPQARLRALEPAVRADMFQLGCTPVVNLFEQPSDPIRYTQTQTEYRVVPDQYKQLALEVYSVDAVESTATYQEKPRQYQPFYSFRHVYRDEPNDRFWVAHRRPSFRANDDGTEVYLSLVDLDFNPAQAPGERLHVRVTCTNRDFASSGVEWTGQFGELVADDIPLVRARCLLKPVPPVRPPLGGALQWRLISHISLNHLSLVDKGREALQEILRLYEFTGSAVLRKQIAGIAAVTSVPAVSRVHSPLGVAFCRGLDVTLTFDEDQFVGSGVYLFAAVLERFLGLYTAINSFSRLTARTLQRKEEIRQWPPLAGEQILL